MKNKWHKEYIPFSNPQHRTPVQIVGDGAIATKALGDGRLIPLLIIDTSIRPDIEDLVEAQVQQPPSDTQSRWGRLSRDKRRIALILAFNRPSKISIILEFDILDQGILIESILTTQAVYLLPGREGDRIASIMDRSRILIEIPEGGFKTEWRKIWPKSLEKHFRKNGLKRRDARDATKSVISELQEIAKSRMQ